MDLEQRQKAAVEYRMAGASYKDIAKTLYYISEEEVKEDINSFISFYGTDIKQNKENHRILEIARLEKLRLSIWKQGLNGDSRAISQLLKISDQYCKLVGITEADVPVTAHENIPGKRTSSIKSKDIDVWLDIEQTLSRDIIEEDGD